MPISQRGMVQYNSGRYIWSPVTRLAVNTGQVSLAGASKNSPCLHRNVCSLSLCAIANSYALAGVTAKSHPRTQCEEL